MIRITVLALAGLKERYLKEACAEYAKRLSGYCKLTICELEPVRLPERPSPAEIEAALDREADMILKKIPSESFVTALCIEGRELSTEQFAEKVGALTDQGRPMTFIVGSSYGLAERVKKRSDFSLSFSKMTFPHQLFRVLLLEQIYRSFKILEGGSYHK